METLARAANRGSISTGYDIDNSVKFEPDNSEFMYFTSTQTGSDIYSMAFSVWLKRTELGTTQTIMLFGNGGSASTRLDITFDTSDRLQVAGISTTYRLTTQVFRDTSAWYHLFFQFDTTQATANDRIKIWVNGNLIDISDFTTVNDPAEDAVLGFNRNYKNVLGARQLIDTSISQLFAGYIAQVYSSGGTPPSVTDFGEFDTDTGIWKPIDISGISPPDSVNGFFLDFTDSSDLGNDASGNSNDFTLNNITSADQATDTPTNNFCTLNPLIYYGYPTTISEGAVKGVDNSAGLGGAAGTIAVNSGKWYWEFKTSASTTIMGIQDIEAETGIADNAHETPYTMGVYLLGQYNYAFDPTQRNDGSTSGLGFDADRRYAVALNLDDDEITYYQNGSSAGTFSLDGLIGLYVRPFASCAGTLQWNFGGYTTMGSYSNSDANGYGNFEYAPPSGYYALCSKNLAEFG